MTSLSLERQSSGLGISPRGPRQTGAGPIGDTEAPSIPQNLSATAISSSQIDLSWDASSDNVAVAGYKVYRDDVLVGTSPTNAYADMGLDAATTYEYEVSAIDAVSNQSARSVPDSATTQSAADTEAPSVPQNLSATAVPPSQIDLAWDASSDNVGVTGYNIYRDNVLIDTSPTNAYSDSGLSVGTYGYEASAFDAAANESARSAPAAATIPDTTAPSVPQNLAATAVSASQIDLAWDVSSDNVAVTGYKIYRDNVLIGTSPTNSTSDTGLASGTLYQYEVSAFDAATNESARSTSASATTPQVIVTAGLVAEWRFDNGAGQVLTDYVGGFHGTLGTGGGADASDPTWTAAGLSFDGSNDFVSIPTMPAIAAVDIVFKTNANISAASAGQALLSHANTSTPIGLGSTTGALTNEIIAVIQDSGDYTSNRRVGWTHASDVMASATWHLIQIDFRSGTPTWDILLDGVSKANAIVGTPVALKSGVAWRFGRTFANTQPLAGQIAYVLAYSAARSAPQVAQNRAALTTILAARGITLP